MANENKIDVLGMLELAYVVAKQSGLQGDARDFVLAHAAVAELIEAAENARRVLDAPQLADWEARRGYAARSVRDALARCMNRR